MQQLYCPACRQHFELSSIKVNSEGYYVIHNECGSWLELHVDNSESSEGYKFVVTSVLKRSNATN